MRWIKKERLDKAQSNYIEAIKITERKLPSWDDQGLNAMFNLARYIYRHASLRIYDSYCLILKVLKALNPQEAYQELQAVKDKNERDLKFQFMTDRFKDIVALLKSITEEEPGVKYDKAKIDQMFKVQDCKNIFHGDYILQISEDLEDF